MSLITSVQNFLENRDQKHSKQIAAFEDNTRHKFMLCGRRGGKTEEIKEEICRDIAEMPPGCKTVYMGPSNQHAMELMWDPLEEAFEQLGWTFKGLQTKQTFKLPGRRKVKILGAENYDRARGSGLYSLKLDELGFFQKPLNKIMRSVRPSLSDYGGRITAATTPPGKGSEAYEFFLNIKNQEDWAFHSWMTWENPGIDSDEIMSALKEFDEKSFRQEYMAEWVSFEGLAYYQFDENLHIKKQPPIDLEQPIVISFDFNVNPTTLLVSQMDHIADRPLIRFKKEYSIKNSSTPTTVENFCEDMKDLCDDPSELQPLKIRGDSSGKNRASQTGFSDYKEVFEVLAKHGFKHQFEVPRKNPAIIDRLNYANSWLKNSYGEHRVEFDPSMSDTIRDMSAQVLEGRFPSDKGNLGHKADAVGYNIYWEHINRDSGQSRTIRL